MKHVFYFAVGMVLVACNQEAPDDISNTQKTEQLVARASNWDGTWNCDLNAVNYYLTIDGQRGTCGATGIQIYYQLQCNIIQTDTYVEFYFDSLIDGDYPGMDRLKPEEPVLTLVKKRGKVVTIWNQITGGEDNKVYFHRAKEN